jgi:hypothetical protein
MLSDGPTSDERAPDTRVLALRHQLIRSSPAVAVWLTGGALQAAGGPATVPGDLLSVIGFAGTVVFVCLWWAYCHVSRADRGWQRAYAVEAPQRSPRRHG